MVLKGQFLERMTLVHSGALRLEALFHEGRRIPTVIASPHPVFGGSMDSAVCSELAWAVTRRGFSSLRFNYRGVGASQGAGHQTSSSAMEEREDLAAAVQLMLQTGKTPRVHVAGYSFGAWLAAHLAATQPHTVERLVLVAPPTREMPFDWPALSAAGVPTRIIVGTADSHVDHEKLAAVASLPNLQLHRIAEGDHVFLRGLAQVGRLAAEHLGPQMDLDELDLEPDEGPPLELDLEPDSD